MRDRWYGDHRDLVKWGTLGYLARTHSLVAIVQVTFLRKDEGTPVLEADGHLVEFPDLVWRHFRSVSNATQLNRACAARIIVVEDVFRPQRRDEYLARVLALLKSVDHNPKAVLLDPDTGIAAGSARAEHVTSHEARTIWANLASRDWLVLYQHAARRRDWLSSSRDCFAKAIGVSQVHTFQAPDFCHDVALFGAERT